MGWRNCEPELAGSQIGENEEDYLPLSSLAQYYYCPRRAGLILLDLIWEDNEFTAAGTVEHSRVHEEGVESRPGAVVTRGLLLRSHRLQITGKADVVELEESESGVQVADRAGRWRLYPVEYKHGKQREELEYEVQLCAQAMCLEEMFQTDVPTGALFYVDDHRRQVVSLDRPLRERVVSGVAALQAMMAAGMVPPPKFGPKCRKCSLQEMCEPQARRNGLAYLRQIAAEAAGATE
jgi:CRISPR-associated exonuclease Cas4